MANPQMISDTEFSAFEKRHIRNGWLWAVVIIAVGALCTVGGLFAQVANQGATEAEAMAYSP
jgi:hypothetical protein